MDVWKYGADGQMAEGKVKKKERENGIKSEEENEEREGGRGAGRFGDKKGLHAKSGVDGQTAEESRGR